MILNSSKMVAEQENIMLDRLYAAAIKFYENPKNQQAYKAWKLKKEAKHNGTNYNHSRPDTRKS